MAKWQNDDMLDAALNYLNSNATLITVCTTQPTTYSEATVTYKLASGAVTSTDFTLASGSSGGRKVTVAQQASLSVDSTGSAQHVALVGSITSVNTLLYVTTCSTQSLTAGNKVTVPAWKVTLGDAA